MSQTLTPTLRWLGQILLLAACYAVAGRLSLLLAIPPGYASAIFPSAGIALGAVLVGGWRLLPGVWLGSFLMNLSFGLGGNALPWSAVGAGALIAIGALLQAALGALLLRHQLSDSRLIEGERPLLQFVLRGAVLSTLVSASIGIGSLYALGAFSRDNVPYSWLTWWVGDSIGVMLVTPLVLMLLAGRNSHGRQQLRAVALPLAVTLALAVLAFFQASKWELARVAADFQQRADNISRQVQTHIGHQLSDLEHLERFFAASDEVTPEEFREFTLHTLANRGELGSIGWLQPVTATERPAHEARMRAAGWRDYLIRDYRSDALPLEPAGARERYYPLVMIEPRHELAALIGIDQASSPPHRDAILNALQTGQLSLSAPVLSTLPLRHRETVIAVIPVITQTHVRRGERQPVLVFSALHIYPSLTRALEGLPAPALTIRLDDSTDPAQTLPLFSNNIRAATNAPLPAYRQEWRYGGRSWRLSVEASEAYVATMHAWQSWLVLVGGLLFTAMVGGLFMLLAGRHARVRQLVAERTQALHQSEMRLSSILDSTLEGIVLVDTRQHIHQCNPAFEELFGYGNGELLHRPITLLLPEWPGLLERSSSHTGVRRELQGHQRGGSIIPVELGWRTLVLEQEVFYLATVHDLTERYAADRLKREFVSVVSHELRTPLTSIRGAISLIHAGTTGELPAPARGLVKIAFENAERLSRLINDLLDMEKLEFGGFSFTLETLAVHPLIERAISENQAHAQSQDVQLTFTRTDGDPHAVLSADRFAQVMNNLLSNAIKFSPRGSVVRIRTHIDGERLCVHVRDQGEGIPAHLHAHVFKKFWQADSSSGRQRGGSGLGLAITRTLVEKMQGEIRFVSTPGEGTEFIVCFPLMR